MLIHTVLTVCERRPMGSGCDRLRFIQYDHAQQVQSRRNADFSTHTDLHYFGLSGTACHKAITSHQCRSIISYAPVQRGGATPSIAGTRSRTARPRAGVRARAHRRGAFCKPLASARAAHSVVALPRATPGASRRPRPLRQAMRRPRIARIQPLPLCQKSIAPHRSRCRPFDLKVCANTHTLSY